MICPKCKWELTGGTDLDEENVKYCYNCGNKLGPEESPHMSPKYIFHGSNARLLDDFLVSGTYFTDDLEIALKYGSTIYAMIYEAHANMFTKTFEGYYISNGHIPLEYLTCLQKIIPSKPIRIFKEELK